MGNPAPRAHHSGDQRNHDPNQSRSLRHVLGHPIEEDRQPIHGATHTHTHTKPTIETHPQSAHTQMAKKPTPTTNQVAAATHTHTHANDDGASGWDETPLYWRSVARSFSSTDSREDSAKSVAWMYFCTPTSDFFRASNELEYNIFNLTWVRGERGKQRINKCVLIHIDGLLCECLPWRCLGTRP